jgi:DNA-binding NarL/FixJ family response regulator
LRSLEDAVSNVLSILVVEDEPEFQRRFAEIVAKEPGFSLAGIAPSVALAKLMLDRAKPDVILVDLGMPDASGIEVIRYCSERYENTDIMVVTVFDDESHVVDSIEAGATGYLLKDTEEAEFIESIKTLHQGGSPVSPVVARHVLERFRLVASGHTVTGAKEPVRRRLENPLSSRETQILQLLAKGFSFNEIGNLLEISPYTVATHIKKIYRKLAVNSRGQAVYEASQLGLLDV